MDKTSKSESQDAVTRESLIETYKEKRAQIAQEGKGQKKAALSGLKGVGASILQQSGQGLKKAVNEGNPFSLIVTALSGIAKLGQGIGAARTATKATTAKQKALDRQVIMDMEATQGSDAGTPHSPAPGR